MLHVMAEKHGDWAEGVDVKILDILGGREEPPPLPASLVEEFSSDEGCVRRGLEQGLCAQFNICVYIALLFPRLHFHFPL